MIVENIQCKVAEIKELKPGDLFTTKNSDGVFILTDKDVFEAPCHRPLTVNLKTGMECLVHDEQQVYLVSGKLIIEA